MTFAIVGVDHTACPVPVRERLALDARDSVKLASELLQQGSPDEVAVVSTCARTEVYIYSEHDVDGASMAARNELERIESTAADHIWERREAAAARHLFRVASGLESQVIGEQQIAGQIREAHEQGQAAGTIHGNLDALFRAAIQCSRRVRTETSVGRLNTSVATAAVAALRRYDRCLQDLVVLVIGAGRIARLVADELRGAKSLVITNRTLSTAAALAEQVGAQALPLSAMLGGLEQFDAVFCATSSVKPILTAQHVSGGRRLLVFDLAVPRNVDPEVRSVPGVVLHDVDSLSFKDCALERDTERVQSVIDSEVHDFVSRHLARKVAPIIAALRAHVDSVRTLEMARIASHLDGMEESQRAAVESLTQRLIDKMFHHLVIRLKLAALTDPNLVQAAEFFFAHGDDGLFPTVDGRQSEALAHGSRG